MGEGWGEGEYNAISTGYIPLPPGEGKSDF